MKCDNCGKEKTWLDMIGANFYCHTCIQKHKLLGLVFRTHIDVFKRIIKKLKPANFEEYMKLCREDIEPIVDLRKYGIKLKTTNVVELD